ncbi:MAG: hypothetical protein DMG30_15075 [Acidobacteria bacterium]|nr:MAG: hypothetical protein DMG30_15075 [Acidobacteriota bacterium]
MILPRRTSGAQRRKAQRSEDYTRRAINGKPKDNIHGSLHILPSVAPILACLCDFSAVTPPHRSNCQRPVALGVAAKMTDKDIDPPIGSHKNALIAEELLMDLLRLLRKSQSVPEKLENPRLLTAMHEIALNDTPAKRKQLYAELLQAALILPTPEVSGKPGLQTSDGQTTIQIIGIKDANNVDVTPVFTDDEALRNWDPNTPSIALKARALFEMLVPLPFQEVIINPFDPRRKMLRPGGRVTRREFESLAKGVPPEPTPAMSTVRPPAGTRLMFGKQKRVFADDVRERVKQTLAKVDGLESAFLLAVAYGDEHPHGAIAVRLAKPLAEERLRFLAKLVLEIVRPSLTDKEPFDLIPLSTQFYEDVARFITPFYEQASNQTTCQPREMR